MSLYPQLSEVKMKKEAYHKQIRAKKRQDYFAAQRKLLLQGQFINQQNTEEKNKTVITSVTQLQDHLAKTYNTDYSAIITYLQTKSKQSLPEHIFATLIDKSTEKQFLRNEHALVLLIKLFNLQEFKANLGNWLTQDRVKYYVSKVIEYNLMLQDPHHMIWRLDFFTTVCWFLFAIGMLTKDKSLMMPIKVHLKIMEFQAYDELPLTFICMLSELSTCPQLLPSQQFIHRLLTSQHNPSQQSQTPEYQNCMVLLLDNYIRYQCQPLYRFEYTDSLELAINYFKYATLKIKQLKFPNKLKIELISLVNAIVKSASDDVLEQLFSIPESRELCEQLFYRAEYGEWEAKSASFECFSEIICSQILLEKITQCMDPGKITHLYVNSMMLQDRQLQGYALACIRTLLQFMPQVYIKHFKNSDYQRKIVELEFSDRKFLQSQDSANFIGLADFARFIYDSYLNDHAKVQD